MAMGEASRSKSATAVAAMVARIMNPMATWRMTPGPARGSPEVGLVRTPASRIRQAFDRCRFASIDLLRTT